MFDKLDNPIDINDNIVKCTGCDNNTQFYQELDTICIVVGASTLLSRKNKKKNKEEVSIGKSVNASECVHFKYLYSRGGTFDHLKIIADPIVAFLRRFFHIEILTCLGVNDILNTQKPYTVIIESAKSFDKTLKTPKKVDTEECKGKVTIKYVTIPFILAVCQLKGDFHELKNGHNRTNHIVFVNRFLVDVLNAKKPDRPAVPTLHDLGISSDPLDNLYPTLNKHVFTLWEYDHPFKKDLARHFRKTKDVIHLNLSSRLKAWNRIHSYFYARMFLAK